MARRAADLLALIASGSILAGCAAAPVAMEDRWHRVDSRTADPIALRIASADCGRAALPSRTRARAYSSCMRDRWYVWVRRT